MALTPSLFHLFSLSMDSSFFLVLLSVSFAFFPGSIDSAKAKPRAFILPVSKDNVTLQYSTMVGLGTPQTSVDLVIDLGGQMLWFVCENGFTSSTYRPVPCGSTKCDSAKGLGCVGCDGTPRPGCTNNTCGVSPYNPVNNSLYSGGLEENTMAVFSIDGRRSMAKMSVPSLAFACGHNDQLQGLANGSQGMVGLAKTQIALQTQLFSTYKIQNKFGLCLPSGKGRGYIFIGGCRYPEDVPRLLLRTPLIINPVSTAPIYSEGERSDEYFIDVKAIRIEGKAVSFNTSLLAIDKDGVGGTKISTVASYTVLHSSIYKALVKDFIKKAAAKDMKRVTAVAPFGACFSSNKTAGTKIGPAVPIIELELQGSGAFWSIHRANSMVKVKKDVMCLGFIDGGSQPRTAIVIGGLQLEDNLLEFDLESSTLGFSSSLHLHNTSCSQSKVMFSDSDSD